MTSDLSPIIKSELANTLEQLLSKNSTIEDIQEANLEEFSSSQSVQVTVKFTFKPLSTLWSFFIPTIAATKFEYFMLGGMGDLKEHIDDEITDAINEIVSNICGSISTASNAQNFEDLGSVKFDLQNNEIIDTQKLSSHSNIYKFLLSLDEEKLPVLISFDENFLPYISSIRGEELAIVESEEAGPTLQPTSLNTNHSTTGIQENHGSSLLSLLGDESVDNLKLLFNIKLKLSVRLGTKLFLLKDILRWDIGEIIELDQMVNEPLEILINGVKIGEGEAVIVEGKFGLKIRSIGTDTSILNHIGLNA